MFSRILVPVDATARGPHAVEMAGSLAARTGASLLLLRVDSWLASSARIAEADQALEAQVAELREAGLKAHYLIQYGRPEDGIAATARYQQSSLIVMAPHRPERLKPLAHGSVTAGMLMRSPAPLLIVPADRTSRQCLHVLQSPGAPIFVPLDGSALAERALPFAADYAAAFDQPMLLVRVLPPAAVAGGEEDEARRYLESVRMRMAPLVHQGIETALLTGTPADEIRRCAEEHGASTIVLSTHGRSGITRTISGSVAADLLRGAAVPLLIVPPGVRLSRVSLDGEPLWARTRHRESEEVLGGV